MSVDKVDGTISVHILHDVDCGGSVFDMVSFVYAALLKDEVCRIRHGWV